MSFGGHSSPPPYIPPPPTPPPPPATLANADVQRRRLMEGGRQGYAGTILTGGGSGSTPSVPTAGKTLLGQ